MTPFNMQDLDLHQLKARLDSEDVTIVINDDLYQTEDEAAFARAVLEFRETGEQGRDIEQMKRLSSLCMAYFKSIEDEQRPSLDVMKNRVQLMDLMMRKTINTTIRLTGQ